MKPSWKGINASHRFCIEEAKRQKLPWVLILEDDCNPVPGAKERFIKLLPIIWERRSEWDIFNGGPTSIQKYSLIQSDPPIFKVGGHASHFILVNSGIYDKIIENLSESSDKIVDVYYRNETRMWTTYPHLATQYNGYSSHLKQEKNYDYLFNISENILKSLLDSTKGDSTDIMTTIYAYLHYIIIFFVIFILIMWRIFFSDSKKFKRRK